MLLKNKNTLTHSCKKLAMAALAAGFLLLPAARPATAQQVYFGTADQWTDLIKSPAQWTYVGQHADGFYANFIMMNRLIRGANGLSEAGLAQTCSSFARHDAYLESDIRTPAGGGGSGGGGPQDGASAEQEQHYISLLHGAGCTVTYTSLNYGWSQARSNNLKTTDLRPGEHRLNLVQVAPWIVNGNISGPSDAAHPNYNETTRKQILEADGVSTDGPLGFWLTDHNHYRSANVSLIRFAHQHGKKVMIMLSPFGAKQPGYDARQDVLKVGQDMVHSLERQGAVPDIYSVFEYATDIPSVPEQVDGKPANTTSGLAFWLIHHIQDPAHYP